MDGDVRMSWQKKEKQYGSVRHGQGCTGEGDIGRPISG